MRDRWPETVATLKTAHPDMTGSYAYVHPRDCQDFDASEMAALLGVDRCTPDGLMPRGHVEIHATALDGRLWLGMARSW